MRSRSAWRRTPGPTMRRRRGSVRASPRRARPRPRGRGSWRPVGRGPLRRRSQLPEHARRRLRRRSRAASPTSVRSGTESCTPPWPGRRVGVGQHGGNWHSIGDSLPIQSVGAIAYTPAQRRHADRGHRRQRLRRQHLRRAGGVPVHRRRPAPGSAPRGRPAAPRASRRPLTRPIRRSSTPRPAPACSARADDGRSFNNVNLPTGSGATGNTFAKPNCFFANMVTDVAVQAPDQFGHKGGDRARGGGLARRARARTSTACPEAPANGLYRSTTGRRAPSRASTSTPRASRRSSTIGRVELGAATGPTQNHGYVYADGPGRGALQQGHRRGARRAEQRRVRRQADGHARPTSTAIYVSKRLRQDLDADGGRQPDALPDQRLVARPALPARLRARHPVLVQRVDQARSRRAGRQRRADPRRPRASRRSTRTALPRAAERPLRLPGDRPLQRQRRRLPPRPRHAAVLRGAAAPTRQHHDPPRPARRRSSSRTATAA